jgi:hypothetical protein
MNAELLLVPYFDFHRVDNPEQKFFDTVVVPVTEKVREWVKWKP